MSTMSRRNTCLPQYFYFIRHLYGAHFSIAGRTEKNQIFQPVKKDTDNLQAVMNTVGEAGDVMHLSQNVVETFIDRIEVFNDECVKIRFTFEDVLKSYEAE